MLHQRHTPSQQSGFTLVELLIVIVAIAILAAISVVAYRGVANSAQAAAIKANLAQAAQKLELYRVDNGGYPPDQTTLATLLKPDSSTTLTYGANNSTSPPTYCLTATSGSLQLSVGSANNTPSDSACVVNLAQNPSLGAGGSGSWFVGSWGTGGAGTSSVQAADGFAGPNFYRMSWSTPNTTGESYVNVHTVAAVSVGTTYTCSGYVRSSFAANVSSRMVFVNASGGWILNGPSASAQPTSATWSRVSVSGVAPANAVTAYCLFVVASSSLPAVGSTYDVDAVMFTQGSTLYNYADGNSPGWSWTGTPNASASIGPPL